MISITIDGASAEEIQHELRKLLNGVPAPSGGLIGTPEFAAAVAAQASEQPRMTAAQKKAAEKAAKEAAAAAASQNIASGAEERVNPEEEQQDAKDEAADTAAQKAAEPAKLTHDDVKKVLGAHVQAYGMAASQADVKLLLNNAEKLSAIPDTQQALAAAIISIADAIEKNPRKHEIAGDGLEKETIAAITPLVQAARAVK